MGKELVRSKMMELLPMCEDHVSGIAQLEKICFCDPWSENSIRSELNNPLSKWLVCVCDGLVVGYVGSQSVCGEADMMNIAVHPDYRRQGIARMLIQRLIEELKANGVHWLMLEVRQSNLNAVTLYQNLGFEKVGLRPGYYRNPKEDAIIMRKEWDV